MSCFKEVNPSHDKMACIIVFSDNIPKGKLWAFVGIAKMLIVLDVYVHIRMECHQEADRLSVKNRVHPLGLPLGEVVGVGEI